MNIDCLSPLIKTYFKAFCDKDLNTIANILSQNVSLKDWNNSVTSKQDVLDVFKSIFNTFLKIDVKIQSFLESDSKVYVEMVLELDDLIINVVDVFTIETVDSVFNDTDNLDEVFTSTKLPTSVSHACILNASSKFLTNSSSKNLIIEISAYKQ